MVRKKLAELINECDQTLSRIPEQSEIAAKIRAIKSLIERMRDDELVELCDECVFEKVFAKAVRVDLDLLMRELILTRPFLPSAPENIERRTLVEDVLDTRIANFLRAGKILYVEQALLLSVQELDNISGIGPISIKKMVEALEGRGYSVPLSWKKYSSR